MTGGGGLEIQSSPHFLHLLHEWPLSTVYKGTTLGGGEGTENERVRENKCRRVVEMKKTGREIEEAERIGLKWSIPILNLDSF